MKVTKNGPKVTEQHQEQHCPHLGLWVQHVGMG